MAEKKIIDCYDVKKQTEAVKQLQKEVDKIPNRKTIEIVLENSAFLKRLEESENRLQRLVSMNHTALLCVNDQATAKIEKVTRKAKVFESSVYMAKLTVDTEAAYKSIAKIENKLENLQGNVKCDMTSEKAGGKAGKKKSFKKSFKDDPVGTIYSKFMEAADIVAAIQAFKQLGRGLSRGRNEKGDSKIETKNFKLPKGLTNIIDKAKGLPKNLFNYAKSLPSTLKGAASTAAKVLPKAAPLLAAAGTAIGAVEGSHQLAQGLTSENKYDKVHDLVGGGSSMAGLAGGALWGTAVLPGVGTAVGGALGYLFGKFSGKIWDDKVADKFAWEDKADSKYADDGRPVLPTEEMVSAMSRVGELGALAPGVDDLKAAAGSLKSAAEQTAANQQSPLSSLQPAAVGYAQAPMVGTLPEQILEGATTLALTGEKEILNQAQVTPSDFGVPTAIHSTVAVHLTPVLSLGLIAGILAGQSAANQLRKPTKEYRGGIVRGFADGGYVKGGAQLITVAEEGTPEAIIPLGKHRRKRALELFQQVGSYLQAPGFSPKAFAAGGIAGGSVPHISAPGAAGAVIENCNVSINVSAKDGESLVESIRAHKQEISEEVAGVFNAVFKGQFANTPA